ncbi:hypothetical protein ACH4S8_43585 [Streptomyces sp. NPDC021080]|uniref:hypothetical protein n=1 Tax=Streptomyces sp. NPDC021080 TaxID=3365110 RepID=UPI003796864D
MPPPEACRHDRTILRCAGRPDKITKPLPRLLVLWDGWETHLVGDAKESSRRVLLRRGFVLEYVTLGWNVVGVVVLAIAAVTAKSVALAGFGLDSLIEIGASAVVIWELSGTVRPGSVVLCD